jgi:FixJ family two-component response regulator
LNRGKAKTGPTVLVVEDDELVLAAVRDLLLALGYRVLAASDPLDALRLFRERPEGIDLLLTDVGMPGMSGSELAEEMQRARPAMPVVYMTGHTEDPIIRARAETGEILLLQKPFDAGTLNRVIRQVLELRPTRSAA